MANCSHRFALASYLLALAISISLLASGHLAIAQNLFVGDLSGNIYEFTPNGTRSTFASGLAGPWGLAFNSSGNLFVASDSIYKYAPNGTQSTFASGVSGGALAVNSSGDLFVSEITLSVDGPGESIIYEFTPNGTQSTFDRGVSGVGVLAFNSIGDLFVAWGGSIYEYVPNGTRTAFASGLSDPAGLAFNSTGNLFVSDFNSGNIYEFTPNGTRSTFASGLNHPSGLAFNSSGDLFETDAYSGNIYEFTPNGTQSTFASGLVFPGPLAFAPAPVWTSAVSGTWSNSGNWRAGVPNGVGVGAVFNVPTTATVTVTLDTLVTLGSLQFGNSGSANVGYTLSGSSSNTLTFNNSGNGATITLTDGTHAINAPVVLADNLTVTAGSTNPWTLSFGTASSISQSGTGSYSLTMSGTGGTLILSGSDSYTGGTFVTAGTLVVTTPAALPEGSSLTVGAGGTLIFDPMASTSSPAISAVPEPSTIALLVVGAMGLLGYAWRRSGGSIMTAPAPNLALYSRPLSPPCRCRRPT
jgi:autotransporter-associated beta strand protein